MPKKGNRNRTRAPHQERRQERQNPNTNAFTALETASMEQEDDMNAHLVERFGRSQHTTNRARSLEPQRPTYRVEANQDLRQYFTESRAPIVATGKWYSQPEIPAPSEILTSAVVTPTSSAKIIDVTEELRPNKVEGAYESNEEYLGTQYDLLREDSIRPLRLAVEKVRTNPYGTEAEYDGNIGVYEPVYIKSIIFSPRGIATRVAFSLRRVKKHVRWSQSKRLITGTLVALSPADDLFQSKCVLATVAARPVSALEQNPPEIDLFFARTDDLEIDPMKKWVMVEARTGFYEASRHTMLALQHMMRESFPLSEHLVSVQSQVEPPKYLVENPFTDMSSLVAMEEEEPFRNVNVLEQWPDSTAHSLDKSQSKALKRILTKRLAIVQGPPGTGKTYTSVVALKILLDKFTRDDPPIIVACQTNHAVDQLLRHIAEFESNFVRLGGRSKDKEVVKKRTLYELRSTFSPPKNAGGLKQQAQRAMTNLSKSIMMLLVPLEQGKPLLSHKLLLQRGLITPEQAESLEGVEAMGISAETEGVYMEQWLGKNVVSCERPLEPDDFGEYEEEDFEVEQLEELEAEARLQDDDFDTLSGARMLLSDNFAGKVPKGAMSDVEVRKLLRDTSDLHAIPSKHRGTVYNYFQREIKRLIRDDFRECAKEYEDQVPLRKVGHWEQDLGILRGQRLIGMTTTGLSKYRGLIAALKPKIILIEEAAETLEAPVTVACLPSLEHLILVGDHQQLRPHCQVKEFEDDPFNFNLSLFERLVLNNVEIDTLTRQRRMIPEIRRLLEPIYGNVLRDHPTVKDVINRPPVEGMGGLNSFFFTHEWRESVDGNKSALNETEADMIVGFFDYLFLNGVDPKKITVLTFYNGQRKTILKKLHNHQNLRGLPLNVVTVDSYQGEENDIVLLSLVRSNRKYQIGFLNVDNRVCVALSRAKRGFYIFGNGEMLASESAVWAEVIAILYGKKSSSDPNKRRHVGYRLPLQCKNHGRKVFIEDPSDWVFINGGCDKKCNCILPCGHTCLKSCHPFAKEQINCFQKCTKLLECGHTCSAQCCESCKCLMCERRHNGVRPMIRPGPVHSGPPPATPALTVRDSEPSGSGSDSQLWTAYANGGAQEDDADFARKLQEENVPIIEQVAVADKLIDVSPTKPRVISAGGSMNTDLLIDLDVGSNSNTSRPRKSTTHTLSYAAAAGSKKENKRLFHMNLLD